MSKRGDWMGDASFAGGEQSDLPPHLIPEDGLLKADNVVLSKTGRLSKRGPVQPYLLTATNDDLYKLAQYEFNGYAPANRGFALGRAGAGSGYGASRWFTFSLANPPTTDRAGTLSAGEFWGGATAAQNNAFVFEYPNTASFPSQTKEYLKGGPAFNYLGLPFFPAAPVFGTGELFYAFAGRGDWSGQPTVSPVAAGTVTVNAGDPIITVANTVLPTGPSYTGNFVYIYRPGASAANRNLYIGVVTGKGTAGANTTLTVFPTPQNGFTGSCYVGISPYASGPARSIPVSTSPLYGAFAFPPVEEPLSIPIRAVSLCAHQNRIVAAPDKFFKLGSVASTVYNASETGNTTIVWSSLTGEPSTASSSNADGILPLQVGGWPSKQSITLETAGIVSLVSMDANNLMVLCQDKTFMLSGVLGTILPAGGVNTSSFNVRTISQRVGCIDALSVQRTPLGVMFASRDGVYVTDGASFTNVMEGKIQLKWNQYVDSILDKSVVITGSALIGETHYVLFTQGQKFICDLYNDFSWTTMSVGPSYGSLTNTVSYGYGIQDYRGRSEVYAPKITDTYDPVAYCDKMVLVDSILITDGDIKTDVPNDGANIDGEFAFSVDAGSDTPMNAEVWTRAYTFGEPSSLKAYKTMTATYLADAKVDGTDPVNTYVAEGLEPTLDTVTPYSTVDPSPSGDTAPLRVSLVPRVIDNGVSFGFKTNYVRTDSPAVGIFSSLCRFSLYELALNFIGLRRGRTKQ